jgi:putative DNA primase/helicase
VTLASRIDPVTVRWLHDGRIAVGMLNVVAGRPGSGKGLFTTHVAAAVSREGVVLLSSAEDHAGAVIRPRLEAAGANLDRVHVERFVLPAGIKVLEERIQETGARLVVIDPFAAHLQGVHRTDDSVRQVTDPLEQLAESTETTFLIVDHVLKHVSPRAQPLMAVGGGSSGLPSAARCVYLVGRDPGDRERVCVFNVKNNAGGPEQPPISFLIEGVPFLDKTGQPGTAGVLLPDHGTAFPEPMAMLVGDSVGRGRPSSERDAAMEWLKGFLDGNEVTAAEVKQEAAEQGISETTLARAKKDLGIEPKQHDRAWWWRLPDAA